MSLSTLNFLASVEPRKPLFSVVLIDFNIKRGGSETIDHIEGFAKKIYEIAGWYVELYIDSRELDGLSTTLPKLPSISIDHLGLSKIGFSSLLSLVEKGAKVKVSGFGRVNLTFYQSPKTFFRPRHSTHSGYL